MGSFAPKYVVDEKRSCIAPEKLEFIDRLAKGTWYYAMTSEEWSGLESDRLSEVLEVKLNGRGITTKVVGKPGQKGFWKQAPLMWPADFKARKGESSGHFELSWKEPRSDKIRYYNLYYSADAPPEAKQSSRIASLPVGTNRYLDWLADPNVESPHYAITAVDRHGNESGAVRAPRKKVWRTE